MIRAIDLAPDGKYVRVTRMLKPFSYDVPVSNFGSIEEIWDADGKVLAKISDRPINLGVQDDTAAAARSGAAAGGGGGGGAEPARASARSRGAPTARASRTSSRNRRRPATRRGGRTGADAAAGRGGRGQRRRRAGGGATAGGAQAPQRKDRVYQWLPPFDDDEPEGDLREHHAHLRPPLLARHADRCSSASAPGRTRSSPRST